MKFIALSILLVSLYGCLQPTEDYAFEGCKNLTEQDFKVCYNNKVTCYVYKDSLQCIKKDAPKE